MKVIYVIQVCVADWYFDERSTAFWCQRDVGCVWRILNFMPCWTSSRKASEWASYKQAFMCGNPCNLRVLKVCCGNFCCSEGILEQKAQEVGAPLPKSHLHVNLLEQVWFGMVADSLQP